MEPVFIDERLNVQKKTFTKWINAHLSKTTCALVKDLFIDLRDGHKLLTLLEVFTNVKYKREKGRMRVHHINNINKTLQVLQENGVKLLNISSEDIVNGNQKLTLGLIYIIALSFDGRKLVNSQAVNGLEKSLLNWVRQYTDPHGLKVTDFSGSWSNGLAFLYILHGNVPDFDLISAVKLHPIARLRMAFDLASRNFQIDQLLDPEDVNTNRPDKKSILMYVMCLYHAIDARQMNPGSIHDLVQHYGSADEIQLLDEKEINRKSDEIMNESNNSNDNNTFQSRTFQESIRPVHVGNVTDLDEIPLARPSGENTPETPSPSIHRSATFTISKDKTAIDKNANNSESSSGNGNSAAATPTKTEPSFFVEPTNSRPISTATNVSVEIGGYQNAIEVVLTLLLEAEEVLSKDINELNDLAECKNQFQEHEEFMIKLSEYQQYVGGALEEGARLMSESQVCAGLTTEDQNEIKHQMFLLNERWETLRMRALNVQSRIHMNLAKVQLEKIEELRLLLTNTEDRISRMTDIGPTYEDVCRQMNEHKTLENYLDDQKMLVEELSNLVVIVNDASFNDLEDRLSALGERWSHVVKWTKNRRNHLEEIYHKWKHLIDHYEIICHWMNARERDLKLMEVKEVTEVGSVMKRMNDLRYCSKDLDILSENLCELQQIAQALQPASVPLLENMENLEDRSEALKQILEVQTSRIEGMGFKFSKVTKDMQLERPESWYDFQHKFTSNESSADESDTETSPQSTKKRKLHRPDNVKQLEVQIHQMIDFIEDCERRVEKFSGVNLKQQGLFLDSLRSDLNNHLNDLQILKDQFDECKTDENLNLKLEDQQITNINSRYADLTDKLEELTAKHSSDFTKDKFYNSLTGFKLVLADCRDWYKQHANSASKDDFQSRLSYMESLSPEINGSQSLWTTELSDDLKEWKQDFDQFYESWCDMKKAIERLIQEQSGIESVGDLLRKLEDFIGEAEENYVLKAEIDQMNENLIRLNELRNRYEEMHEIYLYVCEKISQSSISDDLTQVWEKLPNLLNDRVIKQTTAIENLNHFNSEYDNVVKEMKNIENILREDVFILGEIKTLHKTAEKYEIHATEIKKIEIDIISLKNFCDIIQEDSEPEHKEFLVEKIKNLNNIYTKIIDLYQCNSKKLHQIITQTEDILQRVDQTEFWLNDLEMNTPKVENSDIINSNELFQIKTKFQTLKETCEQRTIAFRELNEAGSEILLQIDDLIQQKTEKKYSYLAKQFTKLNARWNDVTSLVYNRTALLEYISSQLGEFKTLIVSESGYLDRLEKCLRKSPENAADAEEIYEELDDLENSIRNHSDERLEKLQEIGAELINQNFMAESIKTEVNQIMDRWNLLQHQAKQREQMLEEAVSEAQTSESRLSGLQMWVSRVDELLKEYMENDTTMEDLPHDFQRLIEEFQTNEQLIKDLKDEVSSYQQKGKMEAANRLNDQVTLLETRFNGCQEKLNTFTSVQASFETRLNRALGELRNVERNSCILDVLSAGPSNVHDQYEHCLKMYRTLSEIKSEIENVIKTGRKICEEKTTKNPKKLSQGIDALKHLYNALGEHVTQSKNSLDKLMKLANNLTDTLDQIENWVNKHGVQSSDDDDNNKRGQELSSGDIEKLLTKCNEYYEEYKEQCEPIYLEDVKFRIDGLASRFKNINKTDVLKNLNEVKSMLHNLDNVSVDSLRAMEKDLASIDTTNPEVKKLHQQVLDIIKDGITSKTSEMDTEIVIVSDTVRQRRARTPLSNEMTEKMSTETESTENQTESNKNVLPDLLPKTFHLAESSTLFSQILDNPLETTELMLTELDNNVEDRNQRISIVEIRESNTTPKMSVRHQSPSEDDDTEVTPKSNEVTVNTISILESVDLFEPEFVETVNILDASETSDTDTCPSPIPSFPTVNVDDKRDIRNSFDELEEELEKELQSVEKFHAIEERRKDPSVIVVEKYRISYEENKSHWSKDRDLLKDSELNRPSSSRRIAPTLKDILSSTERDSFYGSDKENFEEPLTFSEDEEIPRYSMEMAAAYDSDSDTSRIETPNASKTIGLQCKVADTTSPRSSQRNSNSLNERVVEFQKTALYMVKKMEMTRNNIENCKDGAEAVEHLKLLVAPDAATLISQGDTLVLETHGKSKDLSGTVMHMQTLLREKFHEMKTAKPTKNTISAGDLQKSQSILPGNQNFPKEKKFAEKQMIGNLGSPEDRHSARTEDHARRIIKNVYALMDQSVNQLNDVELANRLEAIQTQQDDLKLVIDIASQATPTPKAKSTMESLEQAKHELSTHRDSIIGALDKLRRTSTGSSGGGGGGERASISSANGGDKLITTERVNGCLKKENSPEPYVPGSFSSKAKAKFLSGGPLAVLASSFDKSVLQISDWLSLEQDMLKTQSVDVCDTDAILLAVQKQKEVLRELEFKKPQLDELVHTAENLKTDSNRQQLQNKVTRLREHWDETSQCVLQRKSQLTSMLGDSQRYEAKRLEIEAWLARMENRAERMGNVATTADVLEAQQKEQKSFHAELHQYKHQIELFSQLTQKLIKVYPSDDTSRIKKMTEAVNLRYNNLNNGVINRGKLLHAAVHNLQSFDRTMDQFLAWLSEAESLCENVEQEIDRNPLVLKVST